MHFYNLIFALLVSQWYLVLAQQSCYWPDGSDSNNTISCDSTEDSVCCLPGDVCLSNNLCFGPGPGMVRSIRLSSQLEQHFRIYVRQEPNTE